jgi:hypothetical protein
MAYFMVLAALANFAGDVLVSGLVKTIQVPSRCQFGVGVVIPQNATHYTSEPEYDQLAVRMAIQAQNTSPENGGLSGIYWKYNADSNFRAEAEDIAGNWTCNDVHQDITYPATETTIADDEGGFQSTLQRIPIHAAEHWARSHCQRTPVPKLLIAGWHMRDHLGLSVSLERIPATQWLWAMGRQSLSRHRHD